MPEYFNTSRLSNINSKDNTIYLNHETDEATTTRYYGFVNHKGYWLISRVVTTTGVTRYAIGKQDFATSWTARVSLSYDYLNNLYT